MQKAEQMVRLNPSSFNKIGKEWNTLNPCANDTVAFWHSGGVDSIPYAVPVFDSVQFKHALDSLTAECKKAYKNGYNAVKAIKVPVKRPDTLLNVVVDRLKYKLFNDSIQALNIQFAEAKGQLLQKDSTIKYYSQKVTGWIWWFILAVVLGIVTNILWAINKIKL